MEISKGLSCMNPLDSVAQSYIKCECNAERTSIYAISMKAHLIGILCPQQLNHNHYECGKSTYAHITCN